jgi:hypothetical protein
MSRRSIIFIPFIALTCVAAAFAFRLGWTAANLTETDVIEAQAEQYLISAGPDALPTDCIAFPGQQRGIWIIVRCEMERNAPSTVYEYHVNRFGGVEYSGAPKSGGPKLRENDV